MPRTQRGAGEPGSTKHRHHALDLLRGLAALGIAIYHFAASNGTEIQSLGTFGVYLFFVLSGVTMMLVYGRTFGESIQLGDLLRFYWNRISRIVPLLAAASIASILIAAPSLGLTRYLAASTLQGIMTGTSLFALHLPGYLSNVIGAWSLGIEMMFYLLFPIVCLLIAKAPLRLVAGAVLVLLAGQQAVIALMHHWVTEDFRRFWDYYSTLLVFSPFFVAGMAIFRFRFRRRQSCLILSLIAFATIATFSLLVDVQLFETHWAYLTLAAVAFAAVLFAYASDVPRILVWPSALLGNASYALYLTHPFTLRASEATAGALGQGTTTAALLYFPFALIIAYCTFLCFETPARRFLRSWFAKRCAADTAL